HGGCPYLVMEYCPGSSLDRALAGRPQPVRDAADLTTTLARAVHHCHERGVVHRDLKPANVLLASGAASAPRGFSSEVFSSEQNPRGADAASLAGLVPKISDFGVAKLLDDDRRLTVSGTVLGTLAYMAPEQAAGRT